MKRILALLLCISLAGCGGDDDIEPVRQALERPGIPNNGGSGGGNPNTPNLPTPDSNSLWEYQQNDSFRSARIYSTNTVPTSNEFNDATMLITLTRYNDDDTDSLELTITVLFADTACDVSCNIRFKKNGRPGSVYSAREFIERVFTNDSFGASDLRGIIKDIQVSNNASITVPLTQTSPESPTEGEFFFDFSGYDTKFMR
ncbi:hypothetical protein ACTXGO_00815 [Psychrobacter sp. T6-1]|uniref:hypothetical protein n=1 Tax=Psychrobacter sp. T6-1 TaxID=3457447 RepID=UPI003FD00147